MHAVPRLIPLNDALAPLGVSRASAYRLAGSGQLELRKVGRGTFVTAAELERFVSAAPVAKIAPPRR
ncbi:helix-turn-helix domain-containing protein [Xanthobacter sp. 126]|uniref:helix-turn-helix domain-containing protein n=1 Tax=Xanthobacter sp. 126 TaxID=1131814 RepID=UPI00045E843F|nr:helix-turn-helix domain-containing protein [Xanthobacter sp. 126]